LKQRWLFVDRATLFASRHIFCCCCGYGWQSRLKLRCFNVVCQR